MTSFERNSLISRLLNYELRLLAYFLGATSYYVCNLGTDGCLLVGTVPTKAKLAETSEIPLRVRTYRNSCKDETTKSETSPKQPILKSPKV